MNILLIVSIVAFYSTQCLSIQPTKIKTRTTTTKTFEKLGNVQFTTMIIDPTLLFFQGKWIYSKNTTIFQLLWFIIILAAQFNDVQLIKKFISSNGNVNMLDLNSKSGLMLGNTFLFEFLKKILLFLFSQPVNIVALMLLMHWFKHMLI